MPDDFDNDSLHDLRAQEKTEHHRRLRQWASRASGGGFGAPFELGTTTLTEKIVDWFQQRGFFSVETSERVAPPNQRNKFSAHGASRFTGSLTKPETDEDS